MGIQYSMHTMGGDAEGVCRKNMLTKFEADLSYSALEISKCVFRFQIIYFRFK